MSDDDNSASGIPSWQRGTQDDNTKPEPSSSGSSNASQPQEAAREQQETPGEEDKLDIARRFLEDKDVKDQSLEKKAAFLKAKGVEDDDIQRLLAETTSTSTTEATLSDTASTTSTPPSTTPAPSLLPTSDRAPIVTYPEFLTTKTPDPPLITTSRLLTTLQITTVLSTLIVGTSKLILSPMLESQTEARTDLHESTSTQLSSILDLLESSVSAIPPAAKRNSPQEGEESEDEDPTELFHRDVGTQTLPVPPTASADALSKKTQSAAEIHESKLKDIAKSLGEVKDGLRAQSDGLTDVKTLIDVFGDELDALTYKSVTDYPLYGADTSKHEADDELKKVRDNIRRIKGTLLSTRSFPSSR